MKDMRFSRFKQALIVIALGSLVSLSGVFPFHIALANPIVDRIAEMKKQADANGDGELSELEREKMRSLFAETIGKSKEPRSDSEESEAPETAAPRQPGPTAGFSEGANCLFVGHSFFVPVARAFDQLATSSPFPRHEARMVFSRGPSGSPGQLWNNNLRKRKIESILATGEIELFGMTTVAGGGGTLDDYRNWINLALKYNPETKIMIGQFWMAGGPNLEDELYKQLTDMIGEKGFEDVEELRQEYPDRIYYVHYGHVGPLMKNEFNAGNLPDITRLIGLGKEALFKDAKIGHAGPLMHELCAITWMAELYRADLGKIAHSDFSEQAAAIARESIENNQQYR